MIKVGLTKSLDVSATQAWEVIADFKNIQRFHPLVDHVDMLSDNERGVGAIRVCNFYDDTSVAEEVTQWKEGQGYTVELSDFSMPVKSATATLTIEGTGAGKSDVTFAMEFTPKFGPLGWVMGQVMMRPMMIRVFKQVLAGLEHHAATGELVGEGWTPTKARANASATAG